MSSSTLSEPVMPEGIAMDLDEVEVAPVRAGGVASLPSDVQKHLVTGTSAVAAGVLLERGTGFIGNLLSARLGGASVFGTYSLGIGTANNIATYAAGGIGATATRFSGKYPYDSREYPEFAKALALVALVSTLLAAAALWLGAAPLAHLLHKPELTAFLRWTAVSAAGVIVLECARGFFVGQRKIAALLVLSISVGIGMLTLVPMAARAGSATAMIVLQGSVAAGAVMVCLLLRKQLRLVSGDTKQPTKGLRSMLREIWSFGFVQLAGMIGSNLAGWWLTTLVARGDTTLTQVGFFAIASQLRNLAGIAPSLLTEGSYAVMASPDHAEARTPHHVMAVCGYASLLVSVVLASVGIVASPWLLRMLYGPAFHGAVTAVSLALAVAVVHMANAPAAARLTIVSIRATAMINTLWAVFVAIGATVVLLHRGSAANGLAIILAAHLMSSCVVLLVLQRRDHLPTGVAWTYLFGSLGTVALAVLSAVRDTHAAQTMAYTAGMALLTLLLTGTLFQIGRRHGWLPSGAAVQQLVRSMMRRAGLGRATGGSHV